MLAGFELEGQNCLRGGGREGGASAKLNLPKDKLKLHHQDCILSMFFSPGIYIGTAVGLIFSGLLASYAGWEWTFYSIGR